MRQADALLGDELAALLERAARRAKLLAKAMVTAIPVLAGVWVTPDEQAAARGLQVWQVTDGHAVPPEQP